MMYDKHKYYESCQDDIETGYRKCPSCFSPCIKYEDDVTMAKCTICGWIDKVHLCVTEGEWQEVPE